MRSSTRRVESSQVAHLWAHQSCEGATGSANTSFHGPVILSYSTPIGRLVKQGRVALFLDQSFSVTTSKHQGWMRSAASHLVCFTVANIDEKPNHKSNLKHYQERISQAAISCSRARDKGRALQVLTGLISAARAYCETFGLSSARFSESDHAKIIEAATEAAKKTASREAVKERKRIAAEKAKLAEWIAGGSETPRLPTQYARISGDELETTLGARVPLEHVKRAAPIVLRILKSGEAWQSNGHKIPLGHFTVDRIDATGKLIAGCHTFNRDEVERIIALVV